MRSLLLIEHDHQTVDPATLSILTAAKQLPNHNTALVLGHECQSIVEEVSQLAGIEQVYFVDAPMLKIPLAETVAPILVQCADEFDYLLAPATAFGKNIMPRVAAQLDQTQVSDLIEIVDADTFIRPIYAGNAYAKVKVLEKKKILTIRSSAFSNEREKQAPAPIKQLTPVINNQLTTWVKSSEHTSERPNLASADIVIGGGRGLQSAENFKLLETLADALGAAIGASRAAVDAGYVPNDWQIGQTGKIISPTLYIAVGISGAIQHCAGIKDSRVIVAINKDPNAPIFKMADYGIVDDLFHVLPELEEALKED